MNAAERQKRIEERFGKGARRLGGKGTARCKQRSRQSVNDAETRLAALLEKMHLNSLGDISSAHLIMDDESVITFDPPAVKAVVQSKIFSVSGKQTRSTVAELMPSIHRKLDKEMQTKHPLSLSPLPNSDKLEDFAEMVEDFEKVADAPAEAETEKVEEVKEEKKEVEEVEKDVEEVKETRDGKDNKKDDEYSSSYSESEGQADK